MVGLAAAVLSAVGGRGEAADAVGVAEPAAVGVSSVDVLSEGAGGVADGFSDVEVVLSGGDVGAAEAVIPGAIEAG